MALYPPIVASSMPAFNIQDKKVRIYYSLSTYNVAKKDDIQSVHITVRNQASNVNVLVNPNEMIEKSFGLQDDIDKVLNRYYVDIADEDIAGGFKLQNLYKVQLRFSNISGSFYTNNINNFSEWSTVCIIKPIQAPEFYINDFYTGQPPQQTDQNNFYSSLADFVGIYNQKDSIEKLKSWRLRLLTEDYTNENILNIDNYTLADSGIVLNQAENYNIDTDSVVLSCSLPYEFTEGVTYKLLFEIQTRNNFEDSLLYNFTYRQSNVNPLSGSLKAYINEEEGYIKLNFTSSEVYMGNLVIRRSDSKSNFLKWEDLKYLEVYNDANFTYYDFTAESGLFYRYLVQKVDARGRRGTPIYAGSDTTKADNSVADIMAEWEHAFLLESTGNGDLEGTTQLKLKYDFQISSYKTNISESKTDTIGSKYPYIRRNGNMYYRSFPITGTITQFMDDASLFTDSDTLFDNRFNKYKEFRGQIGNYVNQYDYTYERKFREKVEEFLYNSKPKLYKSMQEGNIFIKLMQISLTPKNELGRLVYSFTATAYEIDEAKVSTFNNYGLINVGTFNPNISYQTTIMSQISSYDFNDNIEGNLFKAGQDIVGAGSSRAAANSIAKSIKYNEPFNGKIVTDFTINWLRLTIESDPYLIIEQSPNVFRPYDDIDSDGSDSINFTDPIDYQLYQIESTYNGVNVYLGWLFTINDQQIIISPPNNIYELKEDTFSFSRGVNIIPAKDTAMLVDFRLIEVRQEDLSNTPKNKRMNVVNGQLIGTYSEDTELISRINYKYKYSYESGADRIERYVNGVNTILVDTEPGAIVYIKTSAMSEPERFVVNETGELNFDPVESNISITNLRICGITIFEQDTNDLGTFSTLDEIEYPKELDRCQMGGRIYCYYRSAWYPAVLTQNQKFLDISCPVDALVFYYASIMEDYY